MVMIDLSYEILGAIGVIEFLLFAGLVFFGTYWLDIRSKNPELAALNDARKKPFPPVIGLVDLSDRVLFFSGVKDKPHDVKLKKSDYGLLLDPRLASKMPKSRLEDGTPFLLYGVNFHFPISINGARTIVQVIRKIRDEYPKINFIRDDFVLLELLTKSSSEDLYHDIKEVLKTYPVEAESEDIITEEILANTIEEIKSRLKDWGIKSGWVSLKEGIDSLPIGTTSMDMKRVETTARDLERNDMQGEKHTWDDAAKFLVVGVVIIVVSYMVITAMKPA